MRNTSYKRLSPNVLSFIIPLYLLVLHFFPIPITGDSPPLYNPTDIYTVDCGASGNLKAWDNRIWIGDTNSRFSLIEKNKASIISKAAKTSPSVDPVPFATARLSRFQFAYIFPVTTGQKFIRLHFYPSSVAGFDRSKAFSQLRSVAIHFLTTSVLHSLLMPMGMKPYRKNSVSMSNKEIRC